MEETDKARCQECGKKVPKGTLKLEVRMSPGGVRPLHVACAESFVERNQYVGGLRKFAADVAANGKKSVPAFANLPAPTSAVARETLRAAVTAYDADAVRAAIASSTWDASDVLAMVQRSYERAIEKPNARPICIELLEVPGVAEQTYSTFAHETAVALMPEVSRAARAKLSPAAASRGFIEHLRFRLGTALRPAVVDIFVPGVDETHVHDGLCVIHAAVIGGVPEALVHLTDSTDIPVPADIRVAPNVTRGRNADGSMSGFLLDVPSGATPLDLAEMMIAIVDAGIGGWRREDPTDSSTTSHIGALSDWRSRLETIRGLLVAKGAHRSPPRPDPAPIAALRAQLLAVASRAGAGPDVTTALELLRPLGASVGRFLIEGLRALGGHASTIAPEQPELFWQTALGGRIDPHVGFPSTNAAFSDVRVFDSSSSGDVTYDWGAETLALDVSIVPAAAREALLEGEPVALGPAHLWLITGLDSPDEQLVQFDLDDGELSESREPTKRGKLPAFCAKTLRG